jgi:UDP-N-acetyl-D-mannosaminuronic acid dehydrogenase
MICVPTPIRPDHSPDVSYVEQAARAIQPHVQPGNLIILESTSPPRTTENIVLPLAVPAGLKVGQDVFVAHCPERVLPGRILLEVVQNDRVVGGVTAACTQKAQVFYESFVNGQVLATSALAAEVTKLVENSYRDVNIAFANELSMLADRLGIDPWEIIELANRHPRVNILSPGPGVGGHCISVDPWFLVHSDPQFTPLIRTAREVNDRKPHFIVEHVAELAREFAAPKIGCLGLTYKADVDDLRESPSLEIVRELRRRQIGEILACDPHVDAAQFTEFPLHELADVIAQCHILVLLTDHRQFRSVPYRVLQEKVIVDTRGTWR